MPRNHIYCLNEKDDIDIFDSLKTFQFDDSELNDIIRDWPRGELHPMWGVKQPHLTSYNISKKGIKWDKPYPHFNTGKTRSEETKQKMREKRANRVFSKETKQKIRESALRIQNDPQHKELLAAKRRKPITIDGITYSSIKEAKEKLNLSYRKVKALHETYESCN
jgi:hypothetical protein